MGSLLLPKKWIYNYSGPSQFVFYDFLRIKKGGGGAPSHSVIKHHGMMNDLCDYSDSRGFRLSSQSCPPSLRNYEEEAGEKEEGEDE